MTPKFRCSNIKVSYGVIIKCHKSKWERRIKVTIYGYARVSTQGQDLEGQIQQLEKNGCDKIYSEHFTGTKTDRPQFNELLSQLKEGDTLMVTKLDRFARSATQGSELVKELIEKGIKVNILNIYRR